MQKEADKRAKAVDMKLDELAATQRQIIDQVSDLRTDFGGVLKASADDETADNNANGDMAADTAEQSPKEEVTDVGSISAPEASAIRSIWRVCIYMESCP